MSEVPLYGHPARDCIPRLRLSGVGRSTDIRRDLEYQQGGYCNNFSPILAYTYLSSNNHLYVRKQAFSKYDFGRHHLGHWYVVWDGWNSHLDRHTYKTYCWIQGYATYACSISK